MTETLDFFFNADEQGNSVFIVRLLFMEYPGSKGEELMGMVLRQLPFCVFV